MGLGERGVVWEIVRVGGCGMVGEEDTLCMFYFIFLGGGDWRSMFATNFLSYDVRGRASWVQIIMWESFFLGGGG